jgi:hypothetical protein
MLSAIERACGRLNRQATYIVAATYVAGAAGNGMELPRGRGNPYHHAAVTHCDLSANANRLMA